MAEAPSNIQPWLRDTCRSIVIRGHCFDDPLPYDGPSISTDNSVVIGYAEVVTNNLTGAKSVARRVEIPHPQDDGDSNLEPVLGFVATPGLADLLARVLNGQPVTTPTLPKEIILPQRPVPSTLPVAEPIPAARIPLLSRLSTSAGLVSAGVFVYQGLDRELNPPSVHIYPTEWIPITSTKELNEPLYIDSGGRTWKELVELFRLLREKWNESIAWWNEARRHILIRSNGRTTDPSTDPHVWNNLRPVGRAKSVTGPRPKGPQATLIPFPGTVTAQMGFETIPENRKLKLRQWGVEITNGLAYPDAGFKTVEDVLPELTSDAERFYLANFLLNRTAYKGRPVEHKPAIETAAERVLAAIPWRNRLDLRESVAAPQLRALPLLRQPAIVPTFNEGSTLGNYLQLSPDQQKKFTLPVGVGHRQALARVALERLVDPHYSYQKTPALLSLISQIRASLPAPERTVLDSQVATFGLRYLAMTTPLQPDDAYEAEDDFARRILACPTIREATAMTDLGWYQALDQTALLLRIDGLAKTAKEHQIARGFQRYAVPQLFTNTDDWATISTSPERHQPANYWSKHVCERIAAGGLRLFITHDQHLALTDTDAAATPDGNHKPHVRILNEEEVAALERFLVNYPSQSVYDAARQIRQYRDLSQMPDPERVQALQKTISSLKITPEQKELLCNLLQAFGPDSLVGTVLDQQSYPFLLDMLTGVGVYVQARHVTDLAHDELLQRWFAFPAPRNPYDRSLIGLTKEMRETLRMAAYDDTFYYPFPTEDAHYDGACANDLGGTEWVEIKALGNPGEDIKDGITPRMPRQFRGYVYQLMENPQDTLHVRIATDRQNGLSPADRAEIALNHLRDPKMRIPGNVLSRIKITFAPY